MNIPFRSPLKHSLQRTVQQVSASMRISLLLLLCGMVGLSACATAPTDPIAKIEYERINDPLEPTNRAIFSFNSVVQSVIINPLARLFNVLPQGVQTAFGNFFANLGEPRNTVNALLQGDPKAAGTSLGRFVTNSTVGMAGLINVTGSENYNPRDFGQTLDKMTGSNSPFLELPLLGSSSFTAGLGMLVDGLYSIPRLQSLNGGDENLSIKIGITQGVSAYGRNLDIIDSIREKSPDPYTSFRSAYQQNRKDFVFGDSEDPLEDFDFE